MVVRIMLLAAMAGLYPAFAAAQAVSLQQAVKQAITTNPDVQARWHAFRAAIYEQEVARGGYFPRVDLTAGSGRESLTEPNQPTNTYNRRNAVLSLTQMLFDGFATRNEVARLGYTKLGRYYEVLDASETTALDATRAYLDVMRYRELARLTQENFAQHDQLFSQIQERVQAGVGRRVDFEQAGGRLALAQSNMLTEASNLHDVSARYLRIVGTLPPGEMIAPGLLKQGIPPSIEEALRLAYQGSPAFNAAIENVRAAQAEAHGRQSNFMPRIDLRARKDITDNYLGTSGRRDNEVVEVVLNYNLFKGGSDTALLRQYAERLKQSQDLRDRSCREIRQTITIAFKDIQSIGRQLVFLDQHQLSIEKAREAYRKQFDIGQRTLLDLLDTENEYFQARRAYVNASFEHAIAHARTLAGMGKLLDALQVNRDGMPSEKDIGQDRFQVDPDAQCPAESPSVEAYDLPQPRALSYPVPQNPPLNLNPPVNLTIPQKSAAPPVK